MSEHDDVAAIRAMAGLATPMALRVAVTLGLPDRLRTGPATPEQVAAELDVPPTALGVLLGHLETLGVVERTEAGHRTTTFGATLCRDADNGLTNLLHLDMAGGRAEMAFVELLHSVTTGEAGYTRRFGQDFWADRTAHPHLRASFDRQMTDRLRTEVPQLVAGYDWGRFTTVVDVGGGNGTLLAAILAAHPGLRGHLVELEATAAAARDLFLARGVPAEVTAGSFFDPLPAGADAYLLCDILHDWDDEHAHRVLARCVEAAAPAGRVLVVEPVGGRRAGTEFDLAMLAIFGGRERRVEEFRDLAAPHGLVLEHVTDISDGRCLLDFRRG
ncbi:methyltransferase [Actinophytocola sp. KF-1]